jgi:hypothetical protein
MEDVSQPAGQFLLIALILAGIGAIMGVGAILYPGYVIIGTIVIIAACIGATRSALQLRNSLTLTGNTLVVRTAAKTHRIPFQQVTYVSAGAYGIYIRTSDGLRIKSLVAENSRWSQRFGLKTKASGIVDVINDAIGAGHHEATAAPVSGTAGPVSEAAAPASGVASGVASAVSAVPGHVPAVTGEVAASPGRAPAGRLVKTVRGLRADDGARRGVPHRRVRNWRGADRQRGGVARTRGPGPGDGDGREHVPHGRALRQGR